MESETQLGLHRPVASVLALERDLVERQHGDLGERALQEFAHLRVASRERHDDLVALELAARALRLVARLRKLDAGRSSDGVELRQPVGGLLWLALVAVHR